MDAIITGLRDALVAFGTWELNGLLAILYTAWEHGAALLAAGAFAILLFWTPPGRRAWECGDDHASAVAHRRSCSRARRPRVRPGAARRGGRSRRL